MMTPPSLTLFLVGALAVWRVTHLLWAEDGPAEIFARLRRLAGSGFFGRLLDCFYCLSLWVAVPFAYWLGAGWIERGFIWLGLSGGAVLLERATAPKPFAPPPALWHEKPLTEEIRDKTEEIRDKEEEEDVLLRQ